MRSIRSRGTNNQPDNRSRGRMIRVLIAEDSPHIRDSLSGLLAGEPDMTLVGAAVDGLEAVERAAAGSAK